MDPERIAPIIVPTGWDAQRDCDYFEARWRPDPTCTDVLWRMMRFHFGVFQSTLDAGLYYFQRKDATLVHIEPRCLTPLEKIEVFFEVARTSYYVASFKERLLEDLQACDFTERERQRVLREYRLARDGAWMYPVIELIDYLGGCGVHLDETMQCETEDYREVKRDFLDERGSEE